MKKNIFTLVIIVLVSILNNNANAQSPDCFKFKEGKFKITDANAGGITVLERIGGYQVENNEGMKATLRFKVTWIDDCTYTLKLDTILRNENKIAFPTDMILKVRIIATSQNSYTQESSSSLYPSVYKSEVVKIR